MSAAELPIQNDEDEVITAEPGSLGERAERAHRKIVARWYRRARFWGTAALIQGVLLAILMVISGQPRLVFEMAGRAIFWLSMGSLLVFLILVLLRFIALVGTTFFENWREMRQRPPEADLSDRDLPLVSVIVPAYNEEKVIEASVSSLLRLNYPNLEICVIDDGSKDATYERALQAAAGAPEGMVRVFTKPNGGKAEALNHGIALCKGDFVLCMDADSVMEPDCIRLMLPHLLKDKGLAAVAGAVKVVNTQNALTRYQAIEYIQGLNLVRRAMSWAHLVNIIPGPIGLFRKAALRDVDFYDSDTFAEDCDVTLKLLMRGWRVMYEPSAHCYTEAPERIRDLFQQRYRWTRGILQAVLKHVGVLKNPIKRPVESGILLYMLFEGVSWPFMSLLSNLILLYLAAAYGVSSLLVVWWLLLATLDMAITVLVLVTEEDSLGLLKDVILYRVFFVLMVDVCKTLATLEEVLGIGMDWGKLARAGRI